MTEGRNARSQALLVVGTCRFRRKTKRLAQAFFILGLEGSSGRAGRIDEKEPDQTAVEIGVMAPERTVLKFVAAPADRHGAQQQGLEARDEGGIAFVDGVLGIVQEMRLMPMSA
jgi:hypothetical protein